MRSGLRRYHYSGQSHFITFTCYHRYCYFTSAPVYELFPLCLDGMRHKFRMYVYGYVVMPEHVHLLMNEPKIATVDRVIQALKLSVAKRSRTHPFWQSRYYDFNVWNPEKTTEKLRYMHRNPVARGLVAKPEDWAWSSFRHYATGLEGAVEIESFWTAAKRHNQLPEFI